MNATTRLNSANNFANCNNHIESNFGSAKSSSNNNIYKRIPTVTTTTKTTLSYSDNNTNNNLPLQQTASNGIAAGQQQQQQQQRLCSPAPAETATSRECSSVAYSTLTTMRLVGAKESGATAADAEEARTKLMPATAIKIISVNNSKSNNNNTKAHKNLSSNNKNSHNNNNNLDNNINKSTTKSTGTTGAKLDSSMLINARNQLSTITTTTSERRQQQEQMGQQQTEHMLSITRDLNQINLKSSLYAEQQAYNANNNNNKHNCRGNNQQEQQQQNSLSTNVSSDNNNGSSNNKHSNAGNNNRQKQQQQIINCNNNNSSKDCDQAIDKNKNTHNNRRIMKNYDNNNNNNSKGSNEPQPQQQQQQLITLTIAKAVQTETNALVSEKISTTTKVNTTTTTTTTTPTPTIERAKAKSTKLTLRKSFSTPASFKIADVAAAMSQSGGSMMIAYNNNNNSRASESYSKSVSKALPKSELLSGKKSDSDGGGDVVVGGGGHVRGAATCTMQPATQSAVASPKVNFAPSPAIITKATQRANASIEAITTTAKTAATTKTSTTTTISASPQLATVDVATRSQTAAHASQQDPPQERQLQQQQQQLRQQQYQQSSTKSVKAKDNDNQVICANKSVSDDGNVVVVADTTTTSSPLPLSPVSFDLDLRFGCAHYKRRAMFVTPCCNKFYKCRFCHDENESHHFDRKTLTELICSECNTRQKVQEQCEACGTRFGKYTCLICNLFDDTDKKQYHCNGCGICRIGGAENFFHCKVCDMCLPIRLKIDGHRCVENISRSHCPVCLGDIHTSRIPCHIPDCGHLLHKTCFDQLLNSGHYTCPICQTSLIDMTALWEYLDAQAVSLPVPKKYENQRIHIFCNDCHKTSKTKFNFIGLKCMQCGAYNTTQDVKRHEPSSA
ncbi:myb-like protein I isoform X2 [Bactrocera neohumeralis]|uniref:myb-like protein I isoform X2 n=1 Tax=Bactrocera neohumeralis TaxID=98809 RepID=UPI0021662310|nr:myb-like protein I isoform X2 [Bactrocera neohumeralis]